MKNQIERAEPSRGAPDAPVCECGKPRRHAGRCKGRRNGGINGTSVIVVPGLFAELEKLRASHVVLLEALQAIDALIPEPKRSNSVRLPIIAEIQEIVRAAIQQAERT